MSWLSKVAVSTGFPSGGSLLRRCILGVVVVTLVQRFGLYPSAGVVFDIFVAIAVMGTMLLFSYFIVRARYRQ